MLIPLHLSVALEECMSLLIEDDDDVARFQPWFLVALPGEGHLLPVLHSLVHGHLQDLPLAIHFAPVALLTPGSIQVGEYCFSAGVKKVSCIGIVATLLFLPDQFLHLAKHYLHLNNEVGIETHLSVGSTLPSP